MPDILKSPSTLETKSLAKLLGRSDESNFSLVELDEFFHGIQCLPRMLMPSEWLEQAMPDRVTSRKETERVAELLVRYYNHVFGNIFAGSFVPHCDGSAAESHEWLQGFASSFSFEQDALETLAEVEAKELGEDDNVPLTGLLLAFNLDFDRIEPGEEGEVMRDIYERAKAGFELGTPEDNLVMLGAIAMSTHRMLETARKQTNLKANADGRSSIFSTETIRREAPKVGRNEPCPCGSGKKYKHCHGGNVQA